MNAPITPHGDGAHTAGPLSYSHDTARVQEFCGHEIRGPGQIKTIYGPIVGYAKTAADARVFANAADLLDVLQTSERNIVSLQDAGLPGPLSEWLSVVRAAIAKATL